ncbi:LD-carboxypeptidase [Pedobacter sp. Leaf41]|uniref:S66 peptidase family protein n=1 Tax=Pedobacter sp. Leaf41 TaxID=1736218 RepID=UPI000702EF59|nr:LD-carboxypeptidase [Pedobacter sp. Leaf41]KQN34337.1 LD-carboxypeptidase [Pedobacter sp. Leaf41]RZK62305.1 MAG: LD-carboxypeptidase [Pedobacter sp.]
MIKQPPYLKKGDKIAIVCPAKKLPKSIDSAISILENWGLEVIIGESVYASHHQFAGTDELRTHDIQHFLDDETIKAIICGRGGYGTIRIIDELDFTKFKQNPKWFIGFSDVTILLSHIIAQTQIQCLHAQMPYTFDESTPEALASLKKVIFGERQTYHYSSEFNNQPGVGTGVLIGGNLTLLVMMQGSVSEMDFDDKILFLEDVGEQEYSIDRMLRMLKRAGKLKNLRGLIIGAFNEIAEEKISFGQTAEQVIWDIVKDYDYPVCFHFPTGHIDNNLCMVLGAEVELKVEKNDVQFKYL